LDGQIIFQLPEINDIISQFFSQIQEAIPKFEPLLGYTASAPFILLAAAGIIFLGIAGEVFFRKTGMPDVLFLMVLGIIIGPVLGLVSQDAIRQIVPYFSAIALILIMYDGGLNLDIRNVIKSAPYAVVLSILGFITSVIVVTVVAFFGLEWELMQSILLGAIVGGSSSIIVFGLVNKLAISDQTRSILSLESAMTDILVTIVAFVLIGIIVSGIFDPNVALGSFANSVGIGVLLGFGIGIPWAFISSKIQNVQHSYMLTIGILFVIFFFEKSFGGSGALAPLIFGLMIGNKLFLSKYLKFKIPEIKADDPTHNQLTFLVRSFFFVFLGLLTGIDRIEYIFFGVVAGILIYVARMGFVKISIPKRLSIFDKKVTQVMIPRGLAAAVVATIPLTLDFPNAQAYPQIVSVIIMTSVVITTIGIVRMKRYSPINNAAELKK